MLGRGKASIAIVVISGIAAPAMPAQVGSSPSPGRPTPVDSRLRSDLEEATQALKRGDNVSAEKGFRRALEIDPNSLQALNDLGIVLARMGRPAEAIPFYQKALTIRPDPATKRNLAIAYFK